MNSDLHSDMQERPSINMPRRSHSQPSHRHRHYLRGDPNTPQSSRGDATGASRTSSRFRQIEDIRSPLSRRGNLFSPSCGDQMRGSRLCNPFVSPLPLVGHIRIQVRRNSLSMWSEVGSAVITPRARFIVSVHVRYARSMVDVFIGKTFYVSLSVVSHG